MSFISQIASFPSVVNEKAARTVAAFVAVGGLAGIVTGRAWIPAVLAVGFALRVLAGPRFSPLGRLAAEVIAPRLGTPKPVPGAPKRFAQAIGLVVTAAAGVSAAMGGGSLSTALLAVLVVFATLEAVAGFCAGCTLFAGLLRVGLIPDSICVECADVSRRPVAPRVSGVVGS